MRRVYGSDDLSGTNEEVADCFFASFHTMLLHHCTSATFEDAHAVRGNMAIHCSLRRISEATSLPFVLDFRSLGLAAAGPTISF